jgi:hypothetical protein
MLRSEAPLRRAVLGENRDKFLGKLTGRKPGAKMLAVVHVTLMQEGKCMLKLGTFTMDCTPPVGSRIWFGKVEKATGVRDPLHLRGFVLAGDSTRHVVAALDYLGLTNSAYDILAAALAAAAQVPAEQVIVHCIQQHDAPLLDFELDPILKAENYSRSWWEEVARQCGEAARACLSDLRTIAAVGRGESRLYGYASNRRVLGPDGKVRGSRWSRCDDESIRNAPVGTIDPMLRTVAFRDPAGTILGSMTFYASHPQVSSGRGLFSADAPGEALRLVSKRRAGLHAFFTGPGGNVTAGKYTSFTDLEGNLLNFGRRLADGIRLNLRGLTWEPVERAEWRVISFPFPRQPQTEEKLKAAFASPASTGTEKLGAALMLSCIAYPRNANFQIALLTLGRARILFVPSEPFVEYQLFAQSVCPDQFIAMADNCGLNFSYLPLASQMDEGGYETSISWCSREFEPRFKAAITELLS